jgi:7-carboxy-7-deazaguanine synthase
MFGNNPIRKPEKGNGAILKVQNIFATFQGEGPYTGWPAVFIRLGGCNLACDFCDTEFESFEDYSIEEIINKTNELSGILNANITHGLVVITGGEPLRQPIEKLCTELLKNGYKIQIETNGTLYRDIPEGVDIICSPKNTGSGYYMVRDDLLARVNAFKFIISAQHDLYKNIGNVGQNQYNTPVYVQPMDEQDEQKNKANLALVLKLAAENGYRVSVQMHKVVGVE